MRRFAWIAALMMGLVVIGTASAQETRTFVTKGGMSVTYPASLAATTEAGTQTLLLHSVDVSGMVRARVVGDLEVPITLAMVSISSAESMLDAYRTQIGSGAEYDPTAVQEVTLPNGRALIQPLFFIDLGGAYFIAVEVTGGKFAFVEVVLANLKAAPALDGTEQEWLDLAGSILFDQAPTEVEADDGADLQTLELPRGELLPAAMPAGLGVFSDNVLFPIPEGWDWSSDTPVANTGLLTLQGTSSTILISIVDINPFATFEDWRSSTLSASGITDTDPIALTRADQRSAERYISVVETYYVNLGNQMVATIMVSRNMVEDEDIDAIQAAADRIAVEITRFNRSSPIETVAATCDLHITLEEGQRVLYTCPVGCAAVGSVWGTDVYTGDSGVCTAAIHAGAITDAEGGPVLATWAPGQGEYLASTRNGVTTYAYGAWGTSFTLSAPETE